MHGSQRRFLRNLFVIFLLREYDELKKSYIKDSSKIAGISIGTAVVSTVIVGLAVAIDPETISSCALVQLAGAGTLNSFIANMSAIWGIGAGGITGITSAIWARGEIRNGYEKSEMNRLKEKRKREGFSLLGKGRF